MQITSLNLKEFYDTIQGKVVQRILRQHIRHFWPDAKGQRVLGLGYAAPYLRGLMGEANRVINLTPATLGAVFWPPEDNSLTGVCHEAELPVETNSIDKIIVVHTMDSPDSLDSVLSECWRVLMGQGRLLLILPNRAGLWARSDRTPFGFGTPYSMGQIRHALKHHMFVPEGVERALFFPPTESRLMLATATVWEKIGHRFFNAFGGVNVVEASKQLYAGTPVASQAALRRRIVVAAKPLS